MGNTTRFAYTGDDLIAVTDPLGNTSFLFTDAAGRPVWSQDPLGNQTNFAYSALDDLTQIMDEDGNLTLFAYDADRNLVSVTDANGGITSLRLRQHGPAHQPDRSAEPQRGLAVRRQRQPHPVY